MTYDPAKDSYGCWEYAIAACRADLEAGQKLKPEDKDKAAQDILQRQKAAKTHLPCNNCFFKNQ